MTDGLAATREGVLFNNAGISSTSGEVPASVEEVAAKAAAFICGFVPQALAVADP